MLTSGNNRGIIAIAKDTYFALKSFLIKGGNLAAPFRQDYFYNFSRRGYAQKDINLQPVEIRVQSIILDDFYGSRDEVQYFYCKMALGYHATLFHFSMTIYQHLILHLRDYSPAIGHVRLPIIFRRSDVMLMAGDSIIVKKFRFPTSEELDEFYELTAPFMLFKDLEKNKKVINYWKKVIPKLSLT